MFSFAAAPPRANHPKPLTREELEAIREENFAEDVDIPTEAVGCWFRLQAEAFFASGGTPPVRARFLLLHGIGGCAKLIRFQTQRVMYAMGQASVSADVFEGDVPAKDGDVDDATARTFGDETLFRYYGVETEAVPEAAGKPARTTVGWLSALLNWDVEFTYVGVDAALDRLDRYIEANGPYDALWGFSQGGILATMLTARRLERAARGEGPPPTWRCNILMSAMPPRCGPYRACPPPEVPPLASFPAVSMVGRDDMCYPNFGKLRHLYDRLLWLEHDGGHHPPTGKEEIDELASAIWTTLGSPFSFDASRYRV
jgi:hypothetical protein